ncbi:transposase domain-containing protein [Engelhardtia mirabilis]|uniref:transposase domain-containing protein n=1 Tax=Engelhardtia mirabilis TaxID=2528011 RepID=UPI00119F58DB
MSCKLAEVPPDTYIKDVLEQISTLPVDRIAELTPWGWKTRRTAEAEPGAEDRRLLDGWGLAQSTRSSRPGPQLRPDETSRDRCGLTPCRSAAAEGRPLHRLVSRPAVTFSDPTCSETRRVRLLARHANLPRLPPFQHSQQAGRRRPSYDRHFHRLVRERRDVLP